MILNFFRILSLILLVFIVLLDIPKYKFLKDPQYQFIIALIILIILLAIDTGIGFILGITILLVYYKVYSKILNEKKQVNNIKSSTNDYKDNNSINKSSELEYISNQHLVSAQNNIFDTKQYNSEVKGFKKGYNNENVYGAQGLDFENNNVNGYDKKFYLDYSLNDYFINKI